MPKIFPKYVFYGGAFGAALVAVALASVGSTEANTIAFIAQEDTSKTTPAELGQYQQLDCKTITYDIAKAQIALSGPDMASAQDLQLTFGQVSGKGAWEKLKRREIGRSDTVRFSSDDLEIVTFTFEPPISSKTLCSSADDMAYLRLEGVSAPGVLIHGSAVDAYAGPLYNCVLDNGLPCTGTIIDVAFSLLTLPNTPPVIEAVSDQTIQELETLTFTLHASDPNGNGVTWGSGNLPQGATLDANSGTFTWTPTSDQVKDYKITFVATDDGGPVEESSTLTVFVSVVNIVTATEDNELLLDTVISLGFEENVTNSYVANLKSVEGFLERGQAQAAKNQLDAFSKKLEQDLKKGAITQEQYDTLIAKTNQALEKIVVE